LPNPIVVTGCNAAHYDLVSDLLTSIDDVGRTGLTIGFVHVGEDEVPAEISGRVDRMVHVSDAAAAPALRVGFPLAHLMIKARLPEFFPGHDTYVWLDGDTWVQNRVGLDQIIHCAQFADLCAHPELDPNYHRERAPNDRMLTVYQAYYGAEAAYRDVRLPQFNSGVFGARERSPLWAAWRETLTEIRQKVLETPGLYYSDQAPMHHLVATEKVKVYPLRAVNNWLLHASQPALNLARKRIVAPTYPHEEINILHMTWITKDATFRLGERDVSFRYRSIKALFAETA